MEGDIWVVPHMWSVFGDIKVKQSLYRRIRGLQGTRGLRFPDISVLLNACFIPCPSCSLWFYDASNSHLHFPSSVENIRTIPNLLAAILQPVYFSLCQIAGPSPNSHAGGWPYLLSANASSSYTHLPSLSLMWDLWWTKCHWLRPVYE